jgi:hypothetical protein
MAKHLEGDGTIFADQAIMPDEEKTSLQWSRYSEVIAEDRIGCLNGCRNLTTAIYDGLDVQHEINAVNSQSLGDTVLLWHDESRRRLVGLALCHCGAGTEAGSGACYIKFGAVLPGAKAAIHFDRLVHACETFAKAEGVSRLVTGVNTGRHEAYRKMIALGFRNEIQGVVMDRPNEPAYNKPEIYLIDDWR